MAVLQYYLNYLSNFYDTVPPLAIDGSFGPDTRAAVIDAQNTFGLVADGIVGPLTWQEIYNAYLGVIGTVPPTFTEGVTVPFPGEVLREGSEGDAVRLLQEYLNYIAISFPEIPTVNVTGFFGPRTREAVIAFEELFSLPVNGQVSAIDWAAITDIYSDLYSGQQLREGQYPGFESGR